MDFLYPFSLPMFISKSISKQLTVVHPGYIRCECLLLEDHACFLTPTILHHLPELTNNKHTKAVISQRLKADAKFSKLKSKETTRYNSMAEDAFCLLLEDHACFLTPTDGATGNKHIKVVISQRLKSDANSSN